MDKKIDINALGQAIDTTWGRSSTPLTAGYSVKVTIVSGDRIKLNYMTIVSFTTGREMIELKRRYVEEADRVIAQVVKNVKAAYKDISGSALSIKESIKHRSDDIEIINMNIHNAKRTAYFRRAAIYDIA